jgi:arabinogalactan endo-1,4-beta-galactosidase
MDKRSARILAEMAALLGALLMGTLGLCQMAATGPTVEPAPAQPSDNVYIVGADISWVQQREEAGMRYSENSVQKDMLAILKDHGFNYIRLRVFNDPTKSTPRDFPYSPQGYCDLQHTIAMSKRVKAAGMHLLINFHYSDAWADPGKQYTPTAWKELSFEDLVKKTHDWTKDAITQLKDAGARPDMVQVGNEITPGMMTDRGGSTSNWPQLAQLLKAGLTAVKEVDPKILTMLHIDRGGDNAGTRRWVDNALGQGVEFDVLGLSCYSRWHGPPAQWKANFEDLAPRYPKLKFVMAEVDAQAIEANDIMRGLPDGRGLGTFIWEPEANNANQQLFDNRGVVIPDRMARYDRVVEKYELKKIPNSVITAEFLSQHGFVESEGGPGVFSLLNVRLGDASRDLGFVLSDLRRMPSQSAGSDVRIVKIRNLAFVVRARTTEVDGKTIAESLDNPDSICTISVAMNQAPAVREMTKKGQSPNQKL